MEHAKHRTGARVVAYIEVVLTSILAVLYILKEQSDKQNVTPEFLTTIWVRVGCTGVIFCVQLWVTVLLFQATDEGAEPCQAVYRATTWRNVDIAFLAIGGASSVEMYARITPWEVLVISVGIVVLLRSLLIYLVNKYINELKAATKRRSADSRVLASLV